jgi:hypothetical protein
MDGCVCRQSWGQIHLQGSPFGGFFLRQRGRFAASSRLAPCDFGMEQRKLGGQSLRHARPRPHALDIGLHVGDHPYAVDPGARPHSARRNRADHRRCGDDNLRSGERLEARWLRRFRRGEPATFGEAIFSGLTVIPTSWYGGVADGQGSKRLRQVDEQGDTCGFGLEAIVSGEGGAIAAPEQPAPERVGGREETDP